MLLDPMQLALKMAVSCCGCWDSNLGALGELPVLLTIRVIFLALRPELLVRKRGKEGKTKMKISELGI